MYFSTLAAATTLLAMAVSASPVEQNDVGGLLLCTGPVGTGTCSHKVYDLEKCHQLEAPYYHSTNTFAPDNDDFFCYPYLTDCKGLCRSPTGCTFGEVDFTYEHKDNLSAIGWDVLISSFECFLKYEDN